MRNNPEEYKDIIDTNYYLNTKKIGLSVQGTLKYLYKQLSLHKPETKEYAYFIVLIRQYIDWNLTNPEFTSLFS
jgi:hypothetical protein